MSCESVIIIFGEWMFAPSDGVIYKYDSENLHKHSETNLPLHLQKLLTFFIENPNRIISKHEINDLLGGGKLRSDLSVLRVISLLRRFLKDDSMNPIYIQTVRKRGFRFIAEVKCNYIDGCSQGIKKTKKSATHLVLICILLVLFFFSYLFISNKSVFSYVYKKLDPRIYYSSSISSMPGIEMHPELSPSGDSIAYTHSLDLEKNYSIIVQNIASKQKWLVKSEVNASLHSPVWYGDYIVYQQLVRNSRCEIRKIRFKIGEAITDSDDFMTSCGVFSYASKIQISPDHEFILFSSKEEKFGQSTIYQYFTESNTRYKLTAPPKSGVGDFALSLSPDGKNIAFIRSSTQTHAQLWSMSLETRVSKLLYESPDFYPTGLSWSQDQKAILLPGNGNFIDIFDMTSGRMDTFINTDEPVIDIAHPKNGLLLFSGGQFWNNTVWKYEYLSDGIKEDRVKALQLGSKDTILQINPKSEGPAAILSERSGEYKFWFYYPDGRQFEFADIVIGNKYAKGEFSADGKKFILQVGDVFWLVENNDAKIILSSGPKVSTQFSWGADGEHIYYTASVFGHMQVYKLHLATSTSSLVDSDLVLLVEAPDGSYKVQLKHDQKNLELVTSTGQINPLPIVAELGFLKKWLVLRSNAIYFVQRASQSGHYEVLKYNLKTANIERTGIKQNLQGRIFSVSLDERFIYIDDGEKGDIDIRMIYLNREK